MAAAAPRPRGISSSWPRRRRDPAEDLHGITRRRYCGLQVEAPGAKAHFLVKGLELKTRDQCDFVRTSLEKVVRALLSTRDKSRAKRVLQNCVASVDACPLRELVLWRKYDRCVKIFRLGRPVATEYPRQ